MNDVTPEPSPPPGEPAKLPPPSNVSLGDSPQTENGSSSTFSNLAATWDASPLDRIGDFVIVRILGEGGMGSLQ